MSVLLSISLLMVFIPLCMKLNMSPDQIMFISAIIVAGGLAGGDK